MGRKRKNFLKKNFGFKGEEEKKFTDGKLKEYYSYKIGFTEVVRAVFKDNPINAYYILTEFKEHTFTCIPNLLTQDVNKKQERMRKFALQINCKDISEAIAKCGGGLNFRKRFKNEFKE